MPIGNLPRINPPQWIEINNTIRLALDQTPTGSLYKAVLNGILWPTSISFEDRSMDWDSPAREEIFIGGNCNGYYLEIAGDKLVNELTSLMGRASTTGKIVTIKIKPIGSVDFQVMSFGRSMPTRFEGAKDSFSLRSTGAVPGLNFSQ